MSKATYFATTLLLMFTATLQVQVGALILSEIRQQTMELLSRYNLLRVSYMLAR